MATGDDTLRALIRLIPPARALKQDLEKQLHTEMFAGTGDMAMKAFNGLRDSAARYTDDPYVEALKVDVPSGATDREKVSLVLLVAGQLAAFLEGQTGLVGLGGSSAVHIQTAPNINGVNLSRVKLGTEVLDALLGRKKKDADEEEEFEDEEDEE